MISYIYQEFIHRKHQLPNSPAATGRRLQPPIYRLQPEGSYNSLNSLAPTRRRLQPPEFSRLQPEGGYNHLVLRIQPEGSSNSLILQLQLEGGYNPLSLPHPVTLKYKCRPTVTTTITATVTIIVTQHCNCQLYPTSHHLITSNLSHQPIQPITVTDTQPNPLTWIIYQGHLSTRCPTSPTHASTKHVPRSPTYHHKICVSTMYQRCTKPSTCTIPSASTMYQQHIPKVHQPCTNTCTKPCINHAPTPVPNHASTMHQHMYQTMHQPCTSTCTKPCINHAPQPVPYASTINHVYQVPIMYHTMYQPCTSTPCTIPCTIYHIPYTMKCVSTIYHITLNHAMYHKISLMYMPISQRCASNNEP
jgi:hypothetical protein